MREPRPLPDDLFALARAQRGALRGAQVRDLLGERGLRGAVAADQLIKLWQGAYALASLNAADPAPAPVQLASTGHSVPVVTRLAAAELTLGRPVTACLHSAAELYGFATDPDSSTHVIGLTPSSRPELRRPRCCCRRRSECASMASGGSGL